MNYIKQKTATLIFIVTILFSCCDNPLVNKNDDNLLVNKNNGKPLVKNEKQLELEIIPSNQVIINWDSTIYQHKTTDWTTFLDTAAIDSLANLLKNSELLIEDMWYPNEDTPCMLPLRAGSEIIVRLSKPDTLIFKYGFQNHEGGFPIGCFGTWRHYKYVNKCWVGKEFKLKVGEEVVLQKENLRIKFLSVPEDSRCPIDVICFWSGNARVALTYQKNLNRAVNDTLNTHLQPHASRYLRYRVILKNLEPYPEGTEPIPPEEYVATIIVKKNIR